MNVVLRATHLDFARPDTDEAEIAAVSDTIRSGWLTTGPKTRMFEEEFARFVGAKHAVAVNSCTAAMHLSLEAIGLKPGDEVITTPYTFAATGEVIRYFDAVPRFVDVEPRYLTIDPREVEAAITPRTRAIIPVHLAGHPAEMEPLLETANRHRVHIIEDAAHALPTHENGRRIGSVGDLTCFSFYATKTLTTGEGGMITTDNVDWADRCRMMSLHGISRDAWKRYTADGSWYYEVVAPGYKYNMTDIASAIGLVQLLKVERMAKRRSAIAERFNAAFADMPELTPPTPPRRGAIHAWHLYMLRLNLERLSIDRAAFINELKQRRIGASVHFIPLHLHPYYRQTYGYHPADFPVAYREYLREISLPIYSRMTDDDVTDVIDAVLGIAMNYRA
jgi:dTDP-4-amino-4,6-dideoxygalactose transaminase